MLLERIDSLITSLNDPPSSYSEEASDNWPHILEGTEFNWRERVIESLRKIRLTDIQLVADEWVFNPTSRASVSLMLFGNNYNAELFTTSLDNYTSTSTAEQSKKEEAKLLSDFFPYATRTNIDVVKNIEELRAKKSKLNYLY